MKQVQELKRELKSMEELKRELKSIKLELKFIREHMIDVDAILTEEEKKLLDESIKHEKEGKLVSLEEIKLKHVRNKA